MDTTKVNRLEIIDHRACGDCGGNGHYNDQLCSTCQGMGIRGGRDVIVAGPAYGKPDNATVELMFQDDNKTLKVFISDKEQA